MKILKRECISFDVRMSTSENITLINYINYLLNYWQVNEEIL